ncbi:hypothetical protein BDR26DRAFT_898057 [Obelidium mucronatum]|nr:hypothetical protein BDR26DRAFT_898057 [Obelidium mucronatum]
MSLPTNLKSQSFANLFRHSNLAAITYTPDSIASHVIQSDEHHRSKGDWGLKHSLPTHLRPAIILASSLDHPLKKSCVYRSAVSDLARLHRFKKLFGAFLSPTFDALNQRKSQEQVSNDSAIDLSRISEQEFAALIKKAQQNRNKEEEGAKRDWESALGVAKETHKSVYSVRSSAAAGTIHPPFYWAQPSHQSDEAHNASFLESTEQAKADEPKDPHTVPIAARYLNPVTGGHAIGISGYVAFLPDSEVDYVSGRPTTALNREFAGQFERKPGNRIDVFVQTVDWDAVSGRWMIGGGIGGFGIGPENGSGDMLNDSLAKSSLAGQGLGSAAILARVHASRPDNKLAKSAALLKRATEMTNLLGEVLEGPMKGKK